jgi:MFS family permease
MQDGVARIAKCHGDAMPRDRLSCVPPSDSLADQPRRPWPARLPFFYGWVILPTAALGLFVSGPGQTFAVSLFVDPLIDEFGWSRTSVSGLYTAGSLTAAGAMFGVGWLLDRFGARVMLTGVGLLMGLASLWMSTVNSQLELYAGFAALRLLGQGSLSLIPTALVAVWFVRRRGRATALAGLGMMAGQVTFPPLIHVLVSNHDWRGAWIGLAIVVWAVILPIAVVLVRRSPESIGLRPDGDTAPRNMSPATAHGDTSDWSLGRAARTRTFWLLMVASTSQSLIGTALIFHQTDLLSTRGVGVGVSAAVLSVMGPASFAGVMIAGILADRYPNRYLLTASQVLLMGAMVLVMFLTTAWQAIAYGALIGFSGGTSITVSAVIWPNYYGRRFIGSIRGVATSVMVGAAALGPLPLSLGFDLTGSYPTVLGVALVLPAACGVMAYAARPPAQDRAST